MRKEVSFFNDTSTAYIAEYDRETPEGYSFRVRRERVLELLPQNGSGKRVLDIACGPGIMAEGVSEKCYSIDCIDAAPDMIEIARKKYGKVPNTTFAVGDVYAINAPADTYDFVTAMGLVEYLDDQDKAMAEIARVTKKGGTVIVTFPNHPSFWRAWARTLRTVTDMPRALYRKVTGKKKYPITHREYTEDEARAYIQRHGLHPESAVYYNFKVTPFPFDGWFPRFTVWQSGQLEKPSSSLRKICATAFIMQATKQ
ncbi:MAG: class I SAM-dependent methyltransferase [Candidatus Pacebacteria bacterium]|nr:class I SAM-dependent methyltransferase [Candidatus Paceibacterota bacterium]